MKVIVQLFGILLILSGLLILVAPEIIFDFMKKYLGDPTLYIFAIAVRLSLGFLLIKFASESKSPTAIKVLGWVVLIAALLLIFMGHENFKDFLSVVIPFFEPYGRFAGLLSLAFGGFLIYAFTSKKNLET